MKSILVLLVIYAAVYAWLSSGGSWEPAPDTSLRVWQPRGCELDLRANGDGGWRADGNALGWIFLPAIAIDRRFVHDARPLA